MFTGILKKELIPAFGCTEPASIAYASLLVAKHLGGIAERLQIAVSGNIVKNVQGVVVPNTGGRRGIKVSAIAGMLASSTENELEVLSTLGPNDIQRIDELLDKVQISIDIKDVEGLYVSITGYRSNDEVCAVIDDKHTNLVHLSRNGEILVDRQRTGGAEGFGSSEYSNLSFDRIFDYVSQVDIDDIRELITRQIQYNYNIAEIGLNGDFGLNVGRTIIRKSRSAEDKARAYTAAGSDARMGGSDAAVVINSGSGNQGMTVSVPVYVYGMEHGYSDEDVIRAVALSNLISIYIKTKIGSLSAFCGAVSAATGAGAAVAFLQTRDRDVVAQTINNSLSNLSGVICDGAKASCAYKISSCVESSFLASELAIEGHTILDGSGVIYRNVDTTIEAIGHVGKNGMRETDRVILNIMTG